MAKRTGIILAWDKGAFSDDNEILLLSLAPFVDLVKVGLESIYAQDNDGLRIADLVSAFAGDEMGKGSMYDAKLDDIGATVEKAIQNILEGRPSVRMLTLHATVSDNALRLAAKACAGKNVIPLAVTVLTDIDEEQCKLRFGGKPADMVESLAENAKNQGISGLVCSPQELARVAPLGMTTVIPGIRPAWASANDQKRVMTPGEAAKAGADYIVVGRPILQPPQGMSPLEAAKLIRKELDEASASA